MQRHRRLPSIRGDEALLPVFILIAFLIGGGSRSDSMALLVLRPLAIMVIGAGLILAFRAGGIIVRERFVLGMIVASMALVLLHLIPLPHGLWASLPGRGPLVKVDALMGNGDAWRPLTMVPHAAWNAFFSLFLPLAVYVAWLVLPAERRLIILPLLIGIAGFSLILGVLQISTGQFYIHRLTTLGSPVGLFANRNHQAVYLPLLVPMMTAFASLADTRRIATRWMLTAVATGLILIPLLLVLGSRAGLLALIVAAIAAAAIYAPAPAATLTGRSKQKNGKSDKSRVVWSIGGVIGGAILLLAITVLFARAEALMRLLQTGGGEIRMENWKTVASIIGQYMPLGSGSGSFVEVFQIHEPLAQIKYTYFNHAHNEPLEIALTLGVPGLLLLGCGLVGWVRASWVLWRGGRRREVPLILGRLGSMIILVLGLASIVDYPLRTPSLAVLMTIAALWMAAGAKHGFQIELSRTARYNGG